MSAADRAQEARERAERLAGRLSMPPLTPDEFAEGVDVIFDLLKFAAAETERANVLDAARILAEQREAETEEQRAVLEDALRQEPDKWSFAGLLTIAELILAADYPPDIFTGASGDPGPRFLVALREAVAECRALAAASSGTEAANE